MKNLLKVWHLVCEAETMCGAPYWESKRRWEIQNKLRYAKAKLAELIKETNERQTVENSVGQGLGLGTAANQGPGHAELGQGDRGGGPVAREQTDTETTDGPR